MKTTITSHKTNVLDAGFGIKTGKSRAIKAIETAISPILENKTLENASIFSLKIVYGTKEITIEELKIINDYMQEKLGNTYVISIHLSENKRLRNKLSVTMEMCSA
ncbi:MAG TPA: hypothetical protein DCM02_10225 [Flavobacterium sp.]|nr:hypothetical protein [Flavobacterium sp.]